MPVPPHVPLLIDIAVFAQAEEFVCGPDPDYIKTVADTYYKLYEKYGIDQLRQDLFNLLNGL